MRTLLRYLLFVVLFPITCIGFFVGFIAEAFEEGASAGDDFFLWLTEEPYHYYTNLY